MATITPEQVQASYRLAKDYHENKVEFGDAQTELVEKYGMNENSARDHINFFHKIVQGIIIKRTVKKDYVRSCLEGILRDYGESALKTALKGLELHIEWRCLKRVGDTAKGVKELHNEFSRKVGFTPIF